MIIRILMLVVAILFTGGAVAFAESGVAPEGYRVMAYDGRTHQYTIHRHLIHDGKPLCKKIVVLCELYQWGKNPAFRDATACELRVGGLYPAGARASWGQLVLVTEQNNLFSIMEGEGAEQTYQQFHLVSIEVLPDAGCR